MCHKNQKQHRCEQCGKAFPQKSHVTHHINTVHRENLSLPPVFILVSGLHALQQPSPGLDPVAQSWDYQYRGTHQVIFSLPVTLATSHHSKGAIYIILQNQLLVKHNWSLQVSLWPALVTALHNEKPSITALVKSITGYIHSMDNWTIHWPAIFHSVISLGTVLCKSPPGEEAIATSMATLDKRGQENMVLYTRLVESLCEQVEKADLHWRHYNTSLTMLCAMLRYNTIFKSNP